MPADLFFLKRAFAKGSNYHLSGGIESRLTIYEVTKKEGN